MTINVSFIQCSFETNPHHNMQKIISFMEKAKQDHAQVVCLPELFLGHYFCKTQDEKNFSLAINAYDNPYIKMLQDACKKLEVVAPFSFYEVDGPNFYNSVVMIDADGKPLGLYRKSHIPDGPGYQEKFYFRPGNTGFKVFNTKFGNIGCGICWDQWFPESARVMTLKGAQLLMYPTAIGAEPHNPSLNTAKPWRRAMVGHAVSNMIPLVAANRVGVEEGQAFYGTSFICDEMGDVLASSDNEECVKTMAIDLIKAQRNRSAFGFFRDRRIECYQELMK